ncbi:MAG: hypothetical protein EBX40_07195, partial [Gammaproteobacteria bacterium]|nr:hypothetical protein [Gammaproteobacteria bacterium]
IQGMGIEGAGKEYANMVNQLATALGLPYVDAQKVMKQAFDYYLEEKKAKQLAEITSLKQTGVQGRFERTQDVSAVKFEQDVSKDIESKREKLTAIDRNLVLVEKAKTIDKMPSERQIVFDDQLVTAYTKMQDPTSVVMPSEYQRTMSTMPKIDQLEAYLSKQFKKGGLLDPKQRQVMIEYLKGFSEDQLNRFNKYVDSSAKRVDQLGASGDEIRKLKFSMGRSEQAPQALNQNQQNAINAYVQRNVPYDVFAQKNPNTAKILGRAEYEKMLKQSKAGQ